MRTLLAGESDERERSKWKKEVEIEQTHSSWLPGCCYAVVKVSVWLLGCFSVVAR